MRRRGRLDHLAPDLAAQRDVVAITQGVQRNDGRAGRPVGVEALPEAELRWRACELHLTVRDVLAGGDARHHLPGRVLRDGAARPADDDDHLGLVVDDRAGQRHVGRRPGQAARELGEGEWRRRELHPALFGVALVVETDAEDLPGVGHRWAEGDLAKPCVRLGPLAAPCQLVELLGAGETRRRRGERIVVGQPGDVVEAAPVLEGRPPTCIDQSEHCVRSPRRPTRQIVGSTCANDLSYEQVSCN